MAYFVLGLLFGFSVAQLAIAWKTVSRLTNNIDDIPKEEI